MIPGKNITSKQKHVLTFLNNLKLQNKASFELVMFSAVKPHDIIKYIERPEDCRHWPMDFVYQVDRAIAQIDIKYIVDLPKIEEQTEEERVLSKLLRKNDCFAFGTNTFFKNEITAYHVITYMQRNEIMYSWNADFILKIQHEVKRVIAFLL